MLVDTSVWIDFFNGHVSPHADRLAQAIATDEAIAVPGLVLTELLSGLGTEAQARKIASLLDAFDPVADLHDDEYAQAACLYRRCRSKGLTVRSSVDCLIAQMCLRDGLSLLTKDSGFEAIAQCSPLRLVEVASPGLSASFNPQQAV